MVSPARRRPFVGMSCAPPPSRKRRSAETTATAAEAADPQPRPQAENKKPPAAVALKVRLKRFHAVAAWSWNANDDVCGICQAAFEGVCPGVKYPGEDCPVVWGKCGHPFHLQCVSKWLGTPASKNSCPICRQDWEFGQNPVSNNNNSINVVHLTFGFPMKRLIRG